MASEVKARQRKAPAPKASTQALTSDQAPTKKQRASKKASEPTNSDSAEAVNPEKKSRKRAADFFAGDEAESSAKTDKPKAEKPSKKVKSLPSTKASKEDGHPVETAKTFPGGDMVEVEPAKVASKARGKKEKEAVVDDVSSELSRGNAVPEPPSKLENKPAKKRKAASDAPNLVDQLAETGPAQKKLRKAETPTANEGMSKAVSDFANSSIEAATKSAAAASEYVGNLVNGGQKSIAEDVTGVAEDVLDEKDATKRARASKKGNSKATKEGTKASKGSRQDIESTESSKLPNDTKDEAVDEQDGDAEEDVDDQTAALLKGFESSDDEVESGDEGYKQGAKIPKLSAKTAKELKKVKAGDDPGVVYIGRIPHGFYEQEMRTYFSQFGDVTKLRLSRNKKTGRSKHFAFLEFASKDVASIVAQTMNNYLMFGHILKCHLVPNEQVHENLWKGANRKFRVVPWAKIEARKLEQPASKEVWGKRIEKEKARREKKLEKVKSIGYEFDVGTLKAVEDVDSKAIEETPVQEASEAAPEEKEKASRKGRARKGKTIEDVPDKASGESEDVGLGGVDSDEVVEQTVIVEKAKNKKKQLVVTEEVTTKKSRKGAKKGKEVETVSADAVVETPNTSIPAVRIAADEIIENISNAAKAVGNAVGLTNGAEEATAETVGEGNETAKRSRKRKVKEDAETKPTKKGKTEEKVELESKPAKEKIVKEKKDKLVKEKDEKPVKEKAVKDKVDKKQKAVKEKKEKAPKEDKKATNQATS